MARKQRFSLLNLYSVDSVMPEFESRIASIEPRRRPSRPWVKTGVLLCFLLGLGSAFVVAGRNVGAQSNHDLAGISRTFLIALAKDDISGALEVCAESPEGRRILAVERRRVFGALTRGESFDPQARILRIHTLNLLRDELSEAGIRWENVKPLAFGGIRTRMLQPSLMKEPASLVWGHLYFSDANRLYQIEVTAWQCGDRFVIADIWDWAPLAVAPSEVEAFAKARSRQFLDERRDKPDDTKIIRPRRIFVPI